MARVRIPTGDAAPPRIAWSVAEVASSLGLGYDAALALMSVHGGPIPSFRAGQYIRVRCVDLEAYTAAAVVPAAS
jgi:hypothetical protein